MANLRYEVQKNEKYGRYLVAAKDLKPGESILSDTPFVLGPSSESSLVCFDCYLPLISKFNVCKKCGLAPVCPGDGCPDHIPSKWHSESECDFFRTLKLTKALHPMLMVQNVGSLIVLRAILKKNSDPKGWEEFMKLETHLDQRKGTSVWEYGENTVKFIQTLGLLDTVEDENVIQKICAAIDVNSFEVRGPAIPAINYAEILRGVYLNAALLAHDCVANTHMSINDNNLLVCHASSEIKKGETIYYNYTDPLKGTAVRQQHLMIGKYFKCECRRCSDNTEMQTFMSSALCAQCKKGFILEADADVWSCHNCDHKVESSGVTHKVQCCLDKFAVINKNDQKELEEYIRYVSLVLAPNHYVLLEAKQRLAGVLRDMINREPHPNKKLLRRKIELCQELMPVLEKLSPGICRTKAITLYELHAAMVQLAKRMFDAREISRSEFMDELSNAENHLKRSLEMLFIEPGNSPEGELCAKALEEYRALKASMSHVLDSIHAEGKAYITEIIE